MNKPVVVLDPGHGGYDPGATYNGLKEKELNLHLALQTARRLDGIKTLLTRERDIYVSLADRVALSRRAEPDLYLSLHANAGGGRGFESFIYSGLGAKDPAVAIQKLIHEKAMESLSRWEIIDRGMKRAAFYVLRQNPYPAVLIESLFLDNRQEAAIWREPLFVETLAVGLARGIRASLGLPGEEKPEKTNQISGNETKTRLTLNGGGQPLYSVQVGAFIYLENARQKLADVQQAGFNDAYIYQKQF